MKKDLSKVSISPNCTGIPPRNDISEARGMSDPFFFSFNILPGQSHLMVAHGICFVSLVMHGETKIELLTEDRDIRCEHLIKFIWSNFLKEKRKHLLEQLASVEKDIASQKSGIKEIEQAITNLKETPQ